MGIVEVIRDMIQCSKEFQDVRRLSASFNMVPPLCALPSVQILDAEILWHAVIMWAILVGWIVLPSFD